MNLYRADTLTMENALTRSHLIVFNDIITKKDLEKAAPEGVRASAITDAIDDFKESYNRVPTYNEVLKIIEILKKGVT